MTDITRGSLEPEKVAEYLDALTRHFGEPVRPVSDYCRGFREWGHALQERAAREESGIYRDANLDRIAEIIPTLEFAIMKSACLDRLIYGGEKLRTEMCPVHKGHWCGLPFDGPPLCGCELTGWIAPNAKYRLVPNELNVPVVPNDS